MDRAKIVNIIIACIFFALGVSLFSMQIISGRKFTQISKRNCVRLLPQDGSRGRILDRNNEVIVGSSLCYDALLMQPDKGKADNIIMQASRVLDINYMDLKKKARNSFIGSYAPVVIARDVGIKKAMAVEELKSGLDGIMIQPRPQRDYPYGSLAAHVVGYLNEIDRWRLTRLEDYGYKTRDIVGFGGIEEKYDYYLRQEQGGFLIEVDHRGRFSRLLGYKPPKNGKDVQLTIDLKIQKIAEQSLGEKKGSVIIMDPYSGEIIAMASFPDFNPEIFIKKNSPAISRVLTSSEAVLLNRSISGVFPPGSVFKLIVASAALETGKINLSYSTNCTGSTFVGKQEFACWNTHGIQNIVNAITHSCNVFFYKTGLLLGGQIIHDYAVKFGFSKLSGIDLPGEVGGFVPGPFWRKVTPFRNWREGDTANLAIGQGELLVTPIQVLRMVAVFANQGYLVSPYVVRSIDGRDISAYQRRVDSLHLKSNVIEQVRKGMRGVAAQSDGTASILGALPVSVAGKTGTAQAPPGLPHGWFAGFFPYQQPKYAICVFLERGGAGYYASSVAKQIIERMINEGLIK